MTTSCPLRNSTFQLPRLLLPGHPLLLWPSMPTHTSTVLLHALHPILPIATRTMSPALQSKVAPSCTRAFGISCRSLTIKAQPPIVSLHLPLRSVLRLLASSAPPSPRLLAHSARTPKTRSKPVPSTDRLLSRLALRALRSKKPPRLPFQAPILAPLSPHLPHTLPMLPPSAPP